MFRRLYLPKILFNHTAAVVMTAGLVLAGCEQTDVGMAIEAGKDAVRAVTLDDADVQRLALEISGRLDQKYTLAPPDNPYARRLQKVLAGAGLANSSEYNFKVYLSPEVNAFALADGTIRINSGLMDLLSDDELLFVIGHEMGHVAEKHIKRKIMMAYAGSAARKAVASQQNEVGNIARSGIGALAESLVNAQFSQEEERSADDFGVTFLKQQGRGIHPAVSALMKLAEQGNRHTFLASHPAPAARAERLRDGTSAAAPLENSSIIKRVVEWITGLWQG